MLEENHVFYENFTIKKGRGKKLLSVEQNFSLSNRLYHSLVLDMSSIFHRPSKCQSNDKTISKTAVDYP